MAFQIKDANSITLSEINHARAVTSKVTDFAPGSVIRTLFEAGAVEIEELYLRMFLGLREAIPVSTFLSFGFNTLPAAYATGYVTVAVGTPLALAVTVPVGTTFLATDGRTYLSRSQVVWGVGSTLVHIPIIASVSGAAQNADPGAITSSPFFNPATYTVSNTPVVNGRDPETDAERQVRFADYIRALSRSTVASCLYAAKSAVLSDAFGDITEYVIRTGIVEQPGIVKIYLYSSIGVPSSGLLAVAQALFDGSRDNDPATIVPGIRAAGVNVEAQAMTERTVPFTITVGVLSGYMLDTIMTVALNNTFGGAVQALLPGETLYVETLVALLLTVPGVASVVPQSSTNIICGNNEALLPGTLTVIPA